METENNKQESSLVPPSDFAGKLTAKIKEEHIKPRPRWYFLLQDYVVVIAGTLSLLVGAGAVAVMLYLFRNNDWDIRPELQPSLGKFLLLTLPYFWLIFLAVFVLILYYNVRHSRHGYRYPMMKIVGAAVAASIVLGGIFYAAGWGEKIDDTLGESAPFYEIMINRRLMIWHRPDEGFLTGLVVSGNPGGDFNIIDPNGQEWLVIREEEELEMPSGSPRGDAAQVGRPVNMMGRVSGEYQFRAKTIRPVGSGRSFMTSHPRPGKFMPR
jgi:hypothetical protein